MNLIKLSLVRLVDHTVGTPYTLGDFLSKELDRRQMSNRTLATGAGVSEAVIRSLRQHGLVPHSKDPDPRTLRAVADYLGINALKLFRLAGYIPPERNALSVRAEFIGEAFDRLPADKQDAVMAVMEALTENGLDEMRIEEIRSDAKNPLAGFDLASEYIVQVIANTLIVESGITQAVELENPKNIPPDLVVYPTGITWSGLPESTRRRVLGLAKAKLNLDYDPTMVEPHWRR
ncbi:MAG: hypothetical protein ACYDBJ_24755 [Aggregatilineales bacterium]